MHWKIVSSNVKYMICTKVCLRRKVYLVQKALKQPLFVFHYHTCESLVIWIFIPCNTTLSGCST